MPCLSVLLLLRVAASLYLYLCIAVFTSYCAVIHPFVSLCYSIYSACLLWVYFDVNPCFCLILSYCSQSTNVMNYLLLSLLSLYIVVLYAIMLFLLLSGALWNFLPASVFPISCNLTLRGRFQDIYPCHLANSFRFVKGLAN